MALQSMTGFARGEGNAHGLQWTWELRSVNGKGLDLRIRLPQGYERLEPEVRRRFTEAFRRGNIQISLSVSDEAASVRPVVNETALEAVLAIARDIAGRAEAEPPRIDGLMNLRGVLEFREPETGAEATAARDAACLDGLVAAIGDLKSMREGEGAAMGVVLDGHLTSIEKLAKTIEADPSRSIDAIRQRLSAQVAILLDAGSGLDPNRLHAEAALLAAKADVREELDRLFAHVAASRDLFAAGGSIGRRMDFLAQEFNREANTICSKSNAAAVTAAGLELKVVIDQLREQIQNLE